MSGKCSICKRNCKDSLSCDICGQVSHPNCAGVSPQEAECLRASNRKIRYFCEKCNIVDIVSTLQQEVNELKNELSEMKKKADEEISVKETGEVGGLSKEEEIISEIIDRQSRANNLIVYNLPEPNMDVVDDSHRTDISNAAKILGTDESVVSKCIRLGKKNDISKIRPLLVRFNTADDVLSVLKSYRTQNNIYVNRDLTVCQRNLAYNVRKEFRRRKDNGENEIKLRYFNGLPKIVKIQTNDQKN